MNEILVGFVRANPAIASFVLTVGGLRLLLKPLMSALHSMAEETHNLPMNEFLVDIEESKQYKFILWLLDYLASIKF